MGQTADLLKLKNERLATLTAKVAADEKALADLKANGHILDPADLAAIAADPDLAAVSGSNGATVNPESFNMHPTA